MIEPIRRQNLEETFIIKEVLLPRTIAFVSVPLGLDVQLLHFSDLDTAKDDTVEFHRPMLVNGRQFFPSSYAHG